MDDLITQESKSDTAVRTFTFVLLYSVFHAFFHLRQFHPMNVLRWIFNRFIWQLFYITTLKEHFSVELNLIELFSN